MHFAAESHVDRSIVGSDDFVNTNCFGTNIVMDTARRLEIGRVIHIGTDEVYGSVEVGSSKETDPLEPRSPYSASKAGSDLIALSYFSTHGLPVTVTRCTNNFGPFQFPEKVIPLFTTNLLDGKKLPLYGDGLNERDWLYVDDHCAGVHLVLQKGDHGEIYNIGAGNETPNRVLVDKLLALHGAGEEMVEYVEDRKGHDRRYSVDITKITALGWKQAAHARRGARRKRWPGTATTAGGGSRSRPRSNAGPHHRRRRPARPRPRRRRSPTRVTTCSDDARVDGPRRPRQRARRDLRVRARRRHPRRRRGPRSTRAESDPTAFAANAFGTRNVAEGARRVGAHVVYVSTDYVFDGTKDGPYHEWDADGPPSVYGASKLAGEREIDPGSTIVRTGWICGAHGNNFVKTMLRLANERDTWNVVDDQRGCPIVQRRPRRARSSNSRSGACRASFHLTNQGATTWYGFACAILRPPGHDPARITRSPTAEYPTPAPRPDQLGAGEYSLAPRRLRAARRLARAARADDQGDPSPVTDG